MGFEPFEDKFLNFRFLVVDDDANVRHIILSYLSKFGFPYILEAKTGMAALDALQNQKKHFDIILSDWDMPDPNGLTLLKAVRKNPLRKNVKFIMITSQVDYEMEKISQAVEWKVDGYIVKPFTGATLREKLKDVLLLLEKDLSEDDKKSQ